MKGETRKCDYDPSTEQYRRYMEGHTEGNSALLRGQYQSTGRAVGRWRSAVDRAPLRRLTRCRCHVLRHDLLPSTSASGPALPKASRARSRALA